MENTGHDRVVDAGGYTPSQVLELFSPNQIGEKSSYHQIAQPQGAYYLVAERGMGKTHILRYLETQLENKGNYVLHIDLNSEILTRYRQLKTKYKREKEPWKNWQLAILELAMKTLAQEFPKLIESQAFRKTPFRNRSRFRSYFRQILYDYYFPYLREYGRKDLAEIESALDNIFKKSSKSIGKRILGFLKSLRLSLTYTPPQMPEQQVSVGVEQVPSQEADLDTVSEELNQRLNSFEKFFWLTFKALGLVAHNTEDQLVQNEPGPLPSNISLYVIADALDQTLHPLRDTELLELVQAVKILNFNAGDICKSDHIYRIPALKFPNFKVVLGIRAVIYDYFLYDRIEDDEQIQSHIERITWDEQELKFMMALRILENKPDDITPEGIDALLADFLPKEIAYFGEVFPTFKFLLLFTAGRPRQILRLWRVCASIVAKKTRSNQSNAEKGARPYQTKLDEYSIIEGVKQFSEKNLVKDIAREYSREFKRLVKLLNFISGKSSKLDRVVSYDDLCQVIEEYITSPKSKQEPLPKWITNSNEVVSVLYQVGVIGLVKPNSVLPADWVDDFLVQNEPHLFVEDFKYLTIRAPYWYALTDIDNEVENRRLFSIKLYDALLKTVASFDEILSDEALSRVDQMVYYLVLFSLQSKLIKDECRGYPEPIDQMHWESITSSIEQTSSLFAKYFLTSQDTKELSHIGLSLRPLLAREVNLQTGKLSFVDYSDFSADGSQSPNQKEIIEPVTNSVKSVFERLEHEEIKRLRQSLMDEPQSLHNNLGIAINEISLLIRNPKKLSEGIQ